MVQFPRPSDGLSVTWRHKYYFRKNCYTSFICYIKDPVKSEVILDFIFKGSIHKSDMGKTKMGEKKSLKTVTVVAKKLAMPYLSNGTR